MKLYDRCMGQCCEDIGLCSSPEKLKMSYTKWSRSGDSRLSAEDDNDIPIIEDIYLIYPMLVFNKANKTHPEGKRGQSDTLVYHYTCKHYDKKNRKCSIYEIRPKMCSSYPNEKGYCNNPKCQWKKAVEARPKEE